MHPGSTTDVHLFAARTGLNPDTTTTDTECLFAATTRKGPSATLGSRAPSPWFPPGTRLDVLEMSPVITQYQDVAYDRLAEEARAAGLHLNWSSRIPYSRLALAAAETIRINQPGSHQAFSAAIFRAYFAIGRDIGDWSVIADCAEEAGIDPFVFKHEMGVADNELERTAHNNDRSAARFSPIFGVSVARLRDDGVNRRASAVTTGTRRHRAQQEHQLIQPRELTVSAGWQRRRGHGRERRSHHRQPTFTNRRRRPPSASGTTPPLTFQARLKAIGSPLRARRTRPVVARLHPLTSALLRSRSQRLVTGPRQQVT
jgi:hypothetical protein